MEKLNEIDAKKLYVMVDFNWQKQLLSANA